MSLFIYGKNSVNAAIKCNRVTDVYIVQDFSEHQTILLIKKMQIKMHIVKKEILNKLVNTNKHQGIVAKIKDYQYYSLNDLIVDGHKIKRPIIVMLDHIEDPHNLGAILRVADAFHVVGVIIKNKSQVQLNATVDKVSTGAINYVKIVKVANLNQTINILKKNGYWIVSTDANAKKNYMDLDYDFPIVLIIGGENHGISKIIKKNSDFLVKIPMYGHVNSLNASNSLSIILSCIVNYHVI